MESHSTYPIVPPLDEPPGGRDQGYRVRRGLSIPAITVLDHRGRILEDQQRRVFRHNAQNGRGADIIFGIGTTGEWNRIANAERQRLIQIEVDEVSRINEDVRRRGLPRIEAWVGVTSRTVKETLANLECALEAGADAAVVAPLSIEDAGDIVSFFRREVSELFDRRSRGLPVFLYDNADIAVNPAALHLRTRDVKRVSRLPFISGIKVSAGRRVLGNYTKGALHYKDRSEFGIYIGDAMLIFQVFKLDDGLLGRMREYWNRYLLHNELPVGVVSGPANALPREWQRAWRACFADDRALMEIYREAFERFGSACRLSSGGKVIDKTIACIKRALKLDGVIDSDRVAEGTPSLANDERQRFEAEYLAIKRRLAESTDSIWMSELT